MNQPVLPILRYLLARRRSVVTELRDIDRLLDDYDAPYEPIAYDRATPAPAVQSKPVAAPAAVPVQIKPKRQYSPETLERMRQTAANARAVLAAKKADATPAVTAPAVAPVDLSPLAAIATPRKTLTAAEVVEMRVAPVPAAPQPKTRMEALMIVSKAVSRPQQTAPLPAAAASFEFVARWAGERGIAFKEWDDLPRVNAKRETLGLPTFKREFPIKGVRG